MSNRVIIAIVLAVAACAGAGWMVYQASGGARGEVRSAESAQQLDTSAIADQLANATPEERREIAERAGWTEDDASGGRQRVVEGGEAPEWVTQDPVRGHSGFDFVRTSSPAEAEEAFLEALSSFEDRAPGASGLSAPEGGWSRAIGSWQNFVQPLIAEDRTAFAEVVTRLGAEAPEPEEGEAPQLAGGRLFDNLSTFFAGASVDLGASEIRRLDPSDPRAVPRMPKMPAGMDLPAGVVPMMMMESEQTDQEGNTTSTTAMVMPLGAIFPKTGPLLERGATVLEVWTPARLAGQKGDEADVTLATMMVRDPSLKAWVPVALRVQLLSEKATELRPTRAGRRRN